MRIPLTASASFAGTYCQVRFAGNFFYATSGRSSDFFLPLQGVTLPVMPG